MSNGKLTEEQVKRATAIVDYLEEFHDIPRDKAAAIVGNLHVETGGTFDPETINPNDNGKAAYGLAQWRGSRAKKLKDFLKSNSQVDPDKMKFVEHVFGNKSALATTQLDFLVHELKGSESKAYRELNAAKGVKDSAKIFNEKFERSADKSNKRPDLAEAYYSIVGERENSYKPYFGDKAIEEHYKYLRFVEKAKRNGIPIVKVKTGLTGKYGEDVVKEMPMSLVQEKLIDKTLDYDDIKTPVTTESNDSPEDNIDIADEETVEDLIDWDDLKPIKDSLIKSWMPKLKSVLAQNEANMYLAAMGNQTAIQGIHDNNKTIKALLSNIESLGGMNPDNPDYATAQEAYDRIKIMGMSPIEQGIYLQELKNKGFEMQGLAQAIPSLFTTLSATIRGKQELKNSIIKQFEGDENTHQRNQQVQSINKEIQELTNQRSLLYNILKNKLIDSDSTEEENQMNPLMAMLLKQ